MADLSDRSKSILAISLGSALSLAIPFELYLGVVPVKGGWVSKANGWPIMVLQGVFGLLLVWYGVRGVQTDNWPPKSN